MDLNSLLNPTQKAAVEYNEGPAIIVAGAGSGKTRVLTYKIAYLLENGVNPSSILALTFTNKAAREMKERISSVVGDEMTRYLWMGTFHSIFYRILRQEVNAIGYQPNFTIYDTSDSKSLIKSLIKEMGLDSKTYTPNGMLSRISALKNHLITPAAYAGSAENVSADRRSQIPDFAQLFSLYCRRCKDANAMDFDDILVYTHALFTQREDILQKYQAHFQYILVDEYQDTNAVQHGIVTRLAKAHSRVCVVGDDAQSIYSFRGAKIDNMLHFNTEFEGCKLFKLEENYRSTQTIVNAANSLISNNINQIKKKVYSNRGKGEMINVIKAYSDFDEAARVAASIDSATTKHLFDYQDIAILYRTNSQSRVLEEALRRVAVPYRIYGGLSFYQRKEIKDILAYLRLIINANDLESLKRVINYPVRGIGDTTLQKLLVFHHEKMQPVFDILNDSISIGLAVNKGTAAKLANFSNIIADMREFKAENDAYATVEYVLSKSGILADVSVNNDPDNESRKENLQEFLKAVDEFCEKRKEEANDDISLEHFLSEVSLLTDMDNEDKENLNAVTLMTVHASKGLEFESVYVVGMEENLFPSMRVESMKELEEERRLFYVAITRAKDCCTVSFADSRFLHGQTQFCTPSRFLSDIDPQYINMPKEQPKQWQQRSGTCGSVDPFGLGGNNSNNNRNSTFNKYNNSSSRFVNENFGKSNARDAKPQQESFYPSTERKLTRLSPSSSSSSNVSSDAFNPKVGDRVAHSRFGEGTVTAMEGVGGDAKATIAFDMHEEKQLIIKYARLQIIK